MKIFGPGQHGKTVNSHLMLLLFESYCTSDETFLNHVFFLLFLFFKKILVVVTIVNIIIKIIIK